MGCAQAKEQNIPSEKMVEGLKNKVRLLEEEINELMCIRDGENQTYERELMVFAFKQVEWRRERKRLKGEMKKLKKILEEKEERLRCMENSSGMVNEYFENELGFLGTSCITEHAKGDKLRRDETVEKWKQLYFAIKVELDDLIDITHQEERTCWRTENEDTIMKLKNEMRAKEEKIEVLKAKLASMEHQDLKRDKEMDILRQSLRIMGHRKKFSKNLDLFENSIN